MLMTTCSKRTHVLRDHIIKFWPKGGGFDPQQGRGSFGTFSNYNVKPKRRLFLMIKISWQNLFPKWRKTNKLKLNSIKSRTSKRSRVLFIVCSPLYNPKDYHVYNQIYFLQILHWPTWCKTWLEQPCQSIME